MHGSGGVLHCCQPSCSQEGTEAVPVAPRCMGGRGDVQRHRTATRCPLTSCPTHSYPTSCSEVGLPLTSLDLSVSASTVACQTV